VSREVASGAKTDRAQLRRLLDQLKAGDEADQSRRWRRARIRKQADRSAREILAPAVAEERDI